jgi:MFS transporter, ACS family, hexuronate transporter
MEKKAAAIVGSAASAAARGAVDRPVTWQMWVPCLAMAACSWLAFFHRQILSVLAPTILAGTGLNAQQFATISSFFFVAYFIANPLWGSVLDYIGLRLGMLIGVSLWSAASISHGWMFGFLGFAVARTCLGLGEGVTFPGGLRTAVESLPPSLRGRAIALSFSGGTLGGAAASWIAIPLGLKYGWRAAFVITGAFGIVWLALWALVARPPFLPKVEKKSTKLVIPNLSERRLWALVFSYALPAIAPGPILTLLSLYLSQGLGVSQAGLRTLLLLPPLAWGLGYFFWGWIADRYAQDNRRPVTLFLVLTVCSLVLGATTWTTSVAITVAIMSWANFIGGGFQMVALKVGSYSFPREQTAMMTGIASGSWALVNYILLQFLGPLFNQHRYAEAFWMIALCPVGGVAVWLFLSRDRSTPDARYDRQQ